MLKAFWRLFMRRLHASRDNAIGQVNHEAVITSVFQEVEINWGYFFILSLANLIALTGLIVNSSPVIIGAMLISPLMGPILSTGFAFVTGNKNIWRSALKKITLSVFLTVLVSAVASFISPLQDLTPEILARTRPNLYDLLIAIFAGLAGAVAICTKKSYMTIVPGVAIATAVIPPLSVTGFGIGTGSIMVMAGGFFLFFTNFVAIIIATSAVLFFFGFSPASHSGLDRASIKKRIMFLLTVLGIICVPLVYTLHQSLTEVRLKKSVTEALRNQFDKPGASRLTSFTHRETAENGIDIDAIINTTSYLSETDIFTAEKTVRATLGKKVALRLSQIKVQPGGLREEPSVKPATAPPQATQRVPAEIVADARNNLLHMARGATDKINVLIAPAAVKEYSIEVSAARAELSLSLLLSRDYPLSSDEVRFLEKMIAGELGVPVSLRVGTTPFVSPLVFSGGQIAVTPEMQRALLATKHVATKNPDISVTVASHPEYPATRRDNRLAAQKRAASVALYLREACGIREERIAVKTAPAAKGRKPTVTVTILPPPTGTPQAP